MSVNQIQILGESIWNNQLIDKVSYPPCIILAKYYEPARLEVTAAKFNLVASKSAFDAVKKRIF